MTEVNKLAALREAMLAKRLIIFVGSGLSLSLGFPDWKKLVMEILNKISTDDPATATFASPLEVDAMTPIQVLNFIEKNHKPAVYKIVNELINKLPADGDYTLHRKLSIISEKLITTNYDKALEHANPTLKLISYKSNFSVSTLHNLENYIFKIHGSIEHIEDCILFESQYDSYYNRQNASLFELEKMFSEKTLLFIGFSMKDPYVTKLFDFIKSLYSGNLEKHYIITTNEHEYKNHQYLYPIIIPSYHALENCIDEIISLTNKSQSIQLADQSSKSKKREEKKVSILILYTAPIDKDTDFNIELIVNCFSGLEVDLFFSYFNTDSLNTIFEYEYVIIFSQCIKNKFLIEDSTLKSKFMELEEIQDYYSETIKGMFIFYFGDTISVSTNSDAPVILINYETKKLKDSLSNLIYKAFKKCDISLLTKQNTYINIDNILLTKLEKGLVSKNIFIPVISKDIDKKNLNKFIGRKTDLENIIRKLIENKYEDKILTIKGAGGIGKTLTASKACYEIVLRGHFENGLYFIPCSTAYTFENFQYEISVCFNLASSKDLVMQIKENYIYKSHLIILDNFETILHSDSKFQILELISNLCEYATIVVTSRQLLKLEFEEVYELRNFTTDEGVALFKSIYNHVSPNEEKILRRDIVERILNNNPLAIKLIAKGLVSHKDLKMLLLELENDLFKIGEFEDIFEGDEDINIEKSHSLYHSVNYSYQKLTEKEKIAFELLSLFPDGIHMENFKRFSKTLINNIIIEDKEVRELDNKSLLENNNGKLKLQSIMNRFADFQFQKRDHEYKLSCYKNVFNYNFYFVNVLSSTRLFTNSLSIRLQDANINNYLKSLSTFHLLEVSNEKKIEYIDEILNIFLITNQSKQFIQHLNQLDEYFKENSEIYKYIQLIKQYTIYCTKEFSDSSKWIKENYPINLISYSQDIFYLNKLVSYILSAFYFNGGFAFEVLKKRLEVKNYTASITHYLFKLGLLSLVEKSIAKWEEPDFFRFETLISLNRVTVDEINNHIKTLYPKDTLEITQMTYLKHKIAKVSDEEIKKLSITNPYTQGLIYLMHAKNTSNINTKKDFFFKAIKNLEQIKYYYSEAIYLFAQFLQKAEDPAFDNWFKTGRDIAQNFHFNYLVFCYDKLLDDNLKIYNSSDYPIPVSIDEINKYLDKYLEYHNNENKSQNRRKLVKT